MVRPARPADGIGRGEVDSRDDRPQRRALPAGRRRLVQGVRPLRLVASRPRCRVQRPRNGTPGLVGVERAPARGRRPPAAAPPGRLGAGHRRIAAGVGSDGARPAARGRAPGAGAADPEAGRPGSRPGGGRHRARGNRHARHVQPPDLPGARRRALRLEPRVRSPLPGVSNAFAAVGDHGRPRHCGGAGVREDEALRARPVRPGIGPALCVRDCPAGRGVPGSSPPARRTAPGNAGTGCRAADEAGAGRCGPRRRRVRRRAPARLHPDGRERRAAEAAVLGVDAVADAGRVLWVRPAARRRVRDGPGARDARLGLCRPPGLPADRSAGSGRGRLVAPGSPPLDSGTTSSPIWC